MAPQSAFPIICAFQALAFAVVAIAEIPTETPVEAPIEAPIDLAEAMSAEGTVCSVSDSPSDACHLHLLQVRARGLPEGLAGPVSKQHSQEEEQEEEKEEEKANTHQSIAVEAETIDAMGLPSAGEQSVAIEAEAIDAMGLADEGSAGSGDAEEESVADQVEQTAESSKIATNKTVEGSGDADAANQENSGDEIKEASVSAKSATKKIAHRHKKVAEEAVVTASSVGQCTAADAASMQSLGGGHSAGSFPNAVADCGKSAYYRFRFHQDYMRDCIQKKLSLSAPCATCFAQAGQYGFDNCKMQCLFGRWCSHRCRGCTGGHDSITQQCVGVALPQPTSC